MKKDISFERAVEMFRKAGPLVMKDTYCEKTVVDFSLVSSSKLQRIECEVENIPSELKRNMKEGHDIKWEGVMDGHAMVSMCVPIVTKWLTVNFSDGDKTAFRSDYYEDGSVYRYHETTRFLEDENGDIYAEAEDSGTRMFYSGATFVEMLDTLKYSDKSTIRFTSSNIDTATRNISDIKINNVSGYYCIEIENYTNASFYKKDIERIKKSFDGDTVVFNVSFLDGRTLEIRSYVEGCRSGFESFDIDVINDTIADNVWRTLMREGRGRGMFILSDKGENAERRYSFIRIRQITTSMGEKLALSAEVENHEGKKTKIALSNLTHINRRNGKMGILYEMSFNHEEEPSVTINIQK